MSELTPFNAAQAIIEPNLVAGRNSRIAFIDCNGATTYGELADDAARFANLLLGAGIHPEQRVLLALEDTVAFPVCFLGAMLAGIVPVPLNTLLTADDYAFIVEDSRAHAIVASAGLVERMPTGGDLLRFATSAAEGAWGDLWARLRACPADPPQSRTRADDVGFWLYTSGTTGRPKGVMHSHRSLLATAENYSHGVLGLNQDDVVFSAAKLFFAYGLGNSLTFPMLAGATTILLDSAPAPEAVCSLINEHQPTVFFGVPTLYAMLLNTTNVPDAAKLRLCVSAGEALPEVILDRWRDATGLEILDGIGSTEMLHIYLSNRSGAVEPGTSGTPVANYQVSVRDESGVEVTPGELGDLYVSGPSMCLGYWNRRQLSLDTFSGHWMRTGDKYRHDTSGAYVYCGRSDDLLKVGGIYVSPMEVENALLEHSGVAEAAVVGHRDNDELIKPKAFVVVASGTAADAALAEQLIEHVAARLAAFKRPRWVEFVDALPKTATGKVQRFKLRS
jgi:benzoate-CoA ligase